METFHDAAIKAFTAAWRSAADRLPSCTGNSRKDCWSKVYGKQADEYGVPVAVSSMWRTQGRKQDMLAKLKAVPSVLDRLKWAPTLQDPHRTWKRWLICVALAARELRKLMHGNWRQHNQAEMKGAIKHRSVCSRQTGQADCQLDQQTEEGSADAIDHSEAPRWIKGSGGGSNQGEAYR